MADFFCLKYKDETGSWSYVDIPYQHCAEGVELTVYRTCTGNKNQLWMWDENRIVSAINLPRFCFGVRELRAGSEIIIHCQATSSNRCSVRWVFEGGYIKSEQQPNLCLGLSGKRIVLQDVNSDSAVKSWITQCLHRTPKPATSCHLGYQNVPAHAVSDSWTLENTVCVKKSTDCTYYCVVGWGPRGYSGIQRISSNHRVVIFSMWNDHRNNVRVIEHGPGVQVESFGGEGTGQKSMKEVPWKENDKVTLRVTGQKVYNDGENYSNTWRCTGMYSFDGATWHLMATFERSGNAPFNYSSFYSFIEDWRRDNYHEGHLIQREAEFSNPKVVTGTGQVIPLRNAMFTRVDGGEDAFAHFKAFAGVNKSNSSFVLSTGGMTGTDIYGSLGKEGYEQRTNKNYATVSL